MTAANPRPQGSHRPCSATWSQLIGCDFLVFAGTDSSEQMDWFGQTVPPKPTTPRSTTRVLDALLGQPLQPPRAVRRPAQSREYLGFLLGPAMAQHRHVPRLLPAVRDRARADALPARRPGMDRRTRDGACAWSSSAGPAPIFPAATATSSPYCGRTCTWPTSTPSAAVTHALDSPLASRNCSAWWPPGTPTPRSPATWAYPRNRPDPSGKHLPLATGIQPDRRRQPRVRRPAADRMKFRRQSDVDPVGNVAARPGARSARV